MLWVRLSGTCGPRAAAKSVTIVKAKWRERKYEWEADVRGTYIESITVDTTLVLTTFLWQRLLRGINIVYSCQRSLRCWMLYHRCARDCFAMLCFGCNVARGILSLRVWVAKQTSHSKFATLVAASVHRRPLVRDSPPLARAPGCDDPSLSASSIVSDFETLRCSTQLWNRNSIRIWKLTTFNANSYRYDAGATCKRSRLAK